MLTLREDGPVMYVPRMCAFVNRWFRSYEEARAAREIHGGYLFPFREHFFVTDAAAVRELGLDPAAPEWALIGWDWVRPRDVEAWERLKEQREVAA